MLLTPGNSVTFGPQFPRPVFYFARNITEPERYVC